MMADQPEHKAYEWAEEMFSDRYDITPKYRDLLAMLAASMMGNPGAAQHFYNRALADGASDEEIRRAVEVARSSQVEIGDLSANVRNLQQETSGFKLEGNTGRGEGKPSTN
jgi:carboxymuconolactone decarboxylase family protein